MSVIKRKKQGLKESESHQTDKLFKMEAVYGELSIRSNCHMYHVILPLFQADYGASHSISLSLLPLKLHQPAKLRF